MTNKNTNTINFILLISLCISVNSCLLFQPKSIAENTGKTIDKTVKDLTSDEKISQITQSAIEGALAGTSSEKSEESIQKLSKVLSETLEKELNKVFTNLDTKTPGEKFSKGVTDNLLSKEVEKKITDMLSDIINTADSGVGIAIGNLDKNINESVSRIFRNLDANLSSLDKQIVQVFSKTLRDSLTGFINGFVEDVDLKALSSKISTDLLSVELRDTLLSIAREVKKEVPLKEDVTDIIGVIKENATSIILLLGAIIAGLMFLRARLKKKREEDLDIASVVHKAMNDDEAFKNKLEKMLADKNRLEDFKKRIDKYRDS